MPIDVAWPDGLVPQAAQVPASEHEDALELRRCVAPFGLGAVDIVLSIRASTLDIADRFAAWQLGGHSLASVRERPLSCHIGSAVSWTAELEGTDAIVATSCALTTSGTVVLRTGAAPVAVIGAALLELDVVVDGLRVRGDPS